MTRFFKMWKLILQSHGFLRGWVIYDYDLHRLTLVSPWYPSFLCHAISELPPFFTLSYPLLCHRPSPSLAHTFPFLYMSCVYIHVYRDVIYTEKVYRVAHWQLWHLYSDDSRYTASHRPSCVVGRELSLLKLAGVTKIWVYIY